MSVTRLICISAHHAAAVVIAASHDADPTHTVTQDGAEVVIGYHNPAWPIDVTNWAHTNGHAADAAAAHVIAQLQIVAAA
jgi:hypothetical protein